MQEIIILGAGAVGSILAAGLSQNNENQVTLLVRPHLVDSLKQSGITIKGELAGSFSPEITDHVKSLAPNSILFLSCKALDLPEAVASLNPILRDDTLLIPLQNGIGILSFMANYLEASPQLIRGVSYIGGILKHPGLVLHTGGNQIGIEESEHMDRLNRCFKQTPLAVRPLKKLKESIYIKAAINSIINPLSALYKIPFEQILEKKFKQKVEGLIEELSNVLSAHEIKISAKEFRERLVRVIHLVPKSYSSMHQDLERGRQTENLFISGAIVKLAEEAGIAVPETEKLFEAIKKCEEERAVI